MVFSKTGRKLIFYCRKLAVLGQLQICKQKSRGYRALSRGKANTSGFIMWQTCRSAGHYSHFRPLPTISPVSMSKIVFFHFRSALFPRKCADGLKLVCCSKNMDFLLSNEPILVQFAFLSSEKSTFWFSHNTSQNMCVNVTNWQLWILADPKVNVRIGSPCVFKH